MAEVSAGGGEGGTGAPALDVCTLCAALWFDPGEYQQIPRDRELGRSSGELAPAARETLAVAETERIARAAEHAHAADGPGELWKWVPGVFGMPVELSETALESRPLATWSLVAICSVLFAILYAIDGVAVAASAWGFIPAQPFRIGGLSILTSFFLHGGWLHVAGNMYFLWVFGDNVEDDIGSRRFLFLALAAHLAGVACHALVDPRPGVPLVGASAGISGVLAYYAVAFPRARLGLFLIWYFYVRWVHFPAGLGLAGWLVLQAAGAYFQLAGFGSVSSAGHLGGAAVGLAAGIAARVRRGNAVRERPAG